jgi:hypothetical protein
MHLRPRVAGEAQFDYLDRSARREASNVRLKLEECFSRYPESDKARLGKRLTSSDDDLFASAVFELVLHELVIRNGHEVVEVEPEVPNSTRKPDFFVRSKGGKLFYLEAANATGESPALKAAKKRRAAAMDVVYAVRCSWHFFDVYPKGLPAKPPRLRDLRERLEAWAQGLEKGKTDELPFSWNSDGLEIVIKPRTRETEQTADERTSVAFEMGEGHSATLGDGLREVLKKKASRYGPLPHPLVVAINDFLPFAGLDELWAALLGSPCVVWRKHSDGGTESLDEESRRFNGVLLDTTGPRRTGLSAVIYVENMTAWSVRQKRGVVVHNPYAIQPIGHGLFGLDEFAPVEDQLVKTEGAALGSCLDLPEKWPR